MHAAVSRQLPIEQALAFAEFLKRDKKATELQGQLANLAVGDSAEIGGYTLLVPRECITPLDMPAQEAMRLVLTAGVTAPPPSVPISIGSMNTFRV